MRKDSHSLADLLVGHTLADRYRVEERIGSGGMSVIYRATDLRLEDRVHDIVSATLRAGGRFPLVVVSGPLFIRFEVEGALRNDWRAELRRLLDAGAEVLRSRK